MLWIPDCAREQSLLMMDDLAGLGLGSLPWYDRSLGRSIEFGFWSFWCMSGVWHEQFILEELLWRVLGPSHDDDDRVLSDAPISIQSYQQTRITHTMA